MDLLATYQNELLALLAILVVIFVYIFIIKKEKQTDDNDKRLEAERAEKESKKTSPLSKKNQEEPSSIEAAPQKHEIIKDEILDLDGKEEGEFIIEEPQKEESLQQPTKTISKRDVPPHGKITKDNFKEFKGQRILVAEDNLINQKVILGLLADSGIEVIVANDGVEALEILEKDSDFTLILMDAHMPRMDGFQATRNIRSNPKYDHIVVVALSGDTAADDIRKMSEAGMAEHLEKPLRVDALYDILYAYTPLESKSSRFKELDVEEGMEISGDDKIFYHEILNEFLNSYVSSYQTIEEFLKQNNQIAADRLLLDISGVAANIGAHNLNKSAINLKSSLNSNDNKSSRLLLDFKEKLENLTQEIKNYLSSDS